MGMRDQHIDSIRKRIYYGPFDLHALIIPAVDEATTQAFAEGELLQNPDAASKVAPEIFMREVATFNITGLAFSAAGSLINGKIRVPYDLDPKFPIGFRVNFSSLDGSGSATFILLLKTIAKGAAFVVKGSVTTALDTLLGLNAVTIANGNEWTRRGILNKIGLSRDAIEEGANLGFTLELDAVSGILATDITLLGIEMDYAVQQTVGQGNLLDRPTKSTGVK